MLDALTKGLHLAGSDHHSGLLGVVDSGKSVIVIGHQLAVMAYADRLIDVGPDAGDEGRIVFQGAPIVLVATRSTVTGEHLAAHIGL